MTRNIAVSSDSHNSIAEQEIELLPMVEETLRDLASRHRLVLMTKGDHAELYKRTIAAARGL